MLDAILTLQMISTLFMCGLIWFVQIVHYPLMAQVGIEGFKDYERKHKSLTTWVVALPMLCEAGSAAGLLWLNPSRISFLSFGLVVVIWASTLIWQIPAHEALQQGFEERVHQKLVRTNWVRTFAWTIRGALVCWMCL